MQAGLMLGAPARKRFKFYFAKNKLPRDYREVDEMILLVETKW